MWIPFCWRFICFLISQFVLSTRLCCCHTMSGWHVWFYLGSSNYGMFWSVQGGYEMLISGFGWNWFYFYNHITLLLIDPRLFLSFEFYFSVWLTLLVFIGFSMIFPYTYHFFVFYISNSTQSSCPTGYVYWIFVTNFAAHNPIYWCVLFSLHTDLTVRLVRLRPLHVLLAAMVLEHPLIRVIVQVYAQPVWAYNDYWFHDDIESPCPTFDMLQFRIVRSFWVARSNESYLRRKMSGGYVTWQ